MGERRWDLVLDRGQVVQLPEADPVGALRRVMALDAAEQLFARDLSVVDMRDPTRPMLRLTEHAIAELERLEGRRQGRRCMRRQLYEVQRAMRARRETALRRGVIAVLDIGTSKVACLVLQFVPEELGEGVEARPVLTQGAFRVIGAANTRSRGIAFGEIAVDGRGERAVRTAIQGAQKMAGLRVDHVIVSFSGGRPRSYGCTGEIEVEHGAVAERDIGHVLAACEIPDYGHDREALHALAGELRARRADGPHRSARADRPRARGRHAPRHRRLDAASQHPALHPALRPRAGRHRGLPLRQRARRAWSRTSRNSAPPASTSAPGATGVSIFVRRQMIYADAVRMGGVHVTSDICQGLQVSMADAERLKTMHGGLVATGLDDRDMIELPSILGDWEHDRRQISRSELIGVMRPRLEEILEEVRARLDASGFEYLPTSASC